MCLQKDCATPSEFLFPNFLSVWSVTSRGCFYLVSSPHGMLNTPRFGGLSWCLAFGGIQGHRYWEKMLGDDNQSKKGWVKRSPFQGKALRSICFISKFEGIVFYMFLSEFLCKTLTLKSMEIYTDFCLPEQYESSSIFIFLKLLTAKYV